MIAIGVAVGVVPFVLGLMADAVGVHRAFLLVTLLAALGMIAAQPGARVSDEDAAARWCVGGGGRSVERVRAAPGDERWR